MSYIVFPAGSDSLESALNLVKRVEGAYALGANHFWHGGVHLKLPSESRAIVAPSGGSVVAHRTMTEPTEGRAGLTMNDKGEKVSKDAADSVESSFSFVLTRHEFTTPQQQSIVYFLLQMHLRCYAHYSDEQKANPPVHLHTQIQYFVNKSEDVGGSLIGDGVNLRSGPTSGDNNVLTVVPEGAEIRFIEAGHYDHSNPSGYRDVELVSPQCFELRGAVVQTGYDDRGRLRLHPRCPIYDKYGLLYHVIIDSPTDGYMGVPLYIGGFYVGELIEGQSLYCWQKPEAEGVYDVILDNITHVIRPNADGELTFESLLDGWRDGGGFYEPTTEEVITLEEAVDSLPVVLESRDVAAAVTLRAEGQPGAAGGVRPVADFCQSFEVNTHASNQCGLAALAGENGEHQIDIPFATPVTLTEPIAVEQLAEQHWVELQPMTLRQPERGYLYCGPGYLRQEIGELRAALDRVEVFDPPIELQAGETLGYPGAHGQSGTQHMELWLADPAFLQNPKGDTLYEGRVDLPAGIPAQRETTEQKTGEAEATTLPPGTELEAEHLDRNRRGANGDLRRVIYEGVTYYAYRGELGSWLSSKASYCPSAREQATVNFYRLHPETPETVRRYEASTLPEAMSLESIPAPVELNGSAHFRIAAPAGDEHSAAYLVDKTTFNQYRLNYYEWTRFFKHTTAEALGFEASGFYRDKTAIEDAVKQALEQAVAADEMEPVPSYRASHPLSHLVIQAGSEWSAAQRADSGWRDAVLDHCWEQAQVSERDQAQGLTREKLAALFEQSVFRYADDIAFYDEIENRVAGLPAHDAVWHAHPLTFLGHIAKLLQSLGPPWMAYVVEEALTYKGVKEGVEPLAGRVKNAYHYYTHDNKTTTSDVPWCASFVSWCLGQAGLDNPQSAWSQAYLNHETLTEVPIQYGAVAVFSSCSAGGDTAGYSTGHVSFVYGKVSDTHYVCLGGNQGNRIKISEYDLSGGVFLSYVDKGGTKHYKKCRGCYFPETYPASYNLPLKNYQSAKDANQQLLKITINESNNGESTR